MDNLTKTQRSKTMSRIRSVETKPEQRLRSILHKQGFRFRKNVKKLPGKPDIVFPKFKTIIFVNGCFWHQHLNCPKATIPKSNHSYWNEKFKNNICRDRDIIFQLTSLGWRVITIWECEIKKNQREVIRKITKSLSDDQKN